MLIYVSTCFNYFHIMLLVFAKTGNWIPRVCWLHCENCGIEVLFNKGFENIRNIYEIYTKYIQIYTRYIQNTRRRPGGGCQARPRGAGPGPARANQWEGVLLCTVVGCIGFFFVYALGRQTICTKKLVCNYC